MYREPPDCCVIVDEGARLSYALRIGTCPLFEAFEVLGNPCALVVVAIGGVIVCIITGLAP